MNAASIWLVVKALIMILPPIIEMVRNGQIRASAQQEVLDALSNYLQAKFDDARTAADTGTTDELSDPNNRATTQPEQHDAPTDLSGATGG